MQINDEYLDELFAHKLGNMEVTPPEDSWHRIENELAGRQRHVRRYWLAAASLALLLSVAASVVYLQTNERSIPEKVALTNIEGTEPERQQGPIVNDITDIREQNRPQPEKQSIGVRGNREMISTSGVSTTDSRLSQISSEPEPTSRVSESIPSVNTVTTDDLPDAPVYVDSWDELVRMPSIKPNHRELLSEKIVKNRKYELPAIVKKNNVPTYDDIAFVDPTAQTQSKKRQKWEITGQFAPVYSYRNITDVPNGMNKSDFDAAESALLAYSGGVTVAYGITGRFSIQTGVFYSQMGQVINNVKPTVNNMYAAVSSNNPPYAKNFVRTSSGNATVVSNMKADVNTNYAEYFSSEVQLLTPNISAPANNKLIERLDYLEIPVLLRYKIVDRKLNFYLLGGMSTNILINNNVFVDAGGDKVKEGTILMARPVNYSSTMGMGVSFQITNDLLIEIEPSFKYYLQSYTTNNMIDSNPYAFGLFTGVVYRF